tara:strand:- start:854 stop:976 length:123 start_codon:yes stop_codon:yes gene_type:complete
MKKKVLFLLFFIFIVASCGKKADPQFKESKFILLSKKITV